MERKYIFFDIDGTLLDDNPGGKILESTYRTLDKLKENGHFVAIATGRAQYMAMDAAKEAHIDCLVTDGGNGITLQNELQYIKPIDFVQANRVIDQCQQTICTLMNLTTKPGNILFRYHPVFNQFRVT